MLAAITAVAALALSGVAHAQQTTFQLDRAQLSGQPDDGLVVWRPYMRERTTFYGAAALGYTLNPLRKGTVTEDPTAQENIDNPVEHQLTTYLMGGIQFAQRFSVGVALPIYMINSGGDDPVTQEVGNGLDRGAAIGDLRFDARAKIYENDSRNFRAGAGGSLFAPTGNENRFASDGQVTGMLYGMAEFHLSESLFLAGHLGPHFKPARGIGNTNGALETGTELRWAFGAFLPLRDNELRLGGSLWGSTGLENTRNSDENTFFGGKNTSIEWLAEVQMDVYEPANLYFSGGGGTRVTAGYGAPDIRLLAMLGTHTTLSDTDPRQLTRPRRNAPDVAMRDKDTDGDGYPDDIDMCPTVKEDGKPPDPSDGCPAPKDRDGDGIMDDVDKCPDDPEDKDNIEDHDGCPETDADNDGIPDTEDACPITPGVKHKDPKRNGCPKQKHKKIIETESGIQLLENIQFETGLANIKPVSYPILDEVVDVLESRPSIKMGVYGHTDSVGGHAMNMQLSKNRAAAVMRYLVQKGISKNRLVSDGFGPDKPIADNSTPEGRAKNRRVEFKILE